ncbi:MDR family MFS transporter [Chengkuizengella sediminis]|uniref:MDR family MFS transporter n=1 Tax=Chengkuizengella sediminis TaxID=1885917 RepID=UPI0013899A15|nr:MFS transporter [Chengkuizengella sediminis]NDI35148.1 MFS transporter [Chengkuizengella sediminis]
MLARLNSIHPINKVLIIGTFFTRTAIFMTIPYLSIYLFKVKGISLEMIGSILGMSALVSIFGGIIGGSLSDRYGREKIIIVSIFLWSLVFIGIGLANHLILFFCLSGLNGLCQSFFEPTARALLSDLTEQEDKLFVFNLRYTAINVGAALGPLIILLLGPSNNTITFYMTSSIYIIYGFVLLFVFHKYKLQETEVKTKERIQFKEAVQTVKNDKVLLFSIIGFTFGVIGFSQFGSTMPQFFENAPHITNGLKVYSFLIILNAVTVLIIQYPITRIGKWISPLFSIMLGTLAISIGLFGMGLFKSLLFLAFSMIIFTIGEVMMFTMTDLFVDQISKPSLKGTYFGAMALSVIGGALGPAIGGILLGHFGFVRSEIVFGILAAINAMAFPILLYVNYFIKKRNEVLTIHFNITSIRREI